MVPKIIMNVVLRPLQRRRESTYAGGTLETTTPIVPITETNKVLRVHFKNGTKVNTST